LTDVSFSFTASFQVHWETKVWFHYFNCFFYSKENFALQITRDAQGKHRTPYRYRLIYVLL